MPIRPLSLIVLVLCVVLVIIGFNVERAPIEGPSPDVQEFFKYGIGLALVAFVAYLAMTRR